MSDIPRSRYAVSRAPLVGAFALVLCTFALPGAANADTITCESDSNQYKQCRANTRGGVTLQTQLSRAPCTRHSTWGYNDRFIWVSNGCRAVFRVGSDSHRSDDKSDDAAAAVAGIALLALGAAAVHEAHENRERREERARDDRYNYNYNYEPRRYQDHYQRHYVDTVNCASNNNRYNYCRANINHGHVRLVRRYSDSSCRYGDDWGYDRRGIWVENGCRATFEVEH